MDTNRGLTAIKPFITHVLTALFVGWLAYTTGHSVGEQAGSQQSENWFITSPFEVAQETDPILRRARLGSTMAFLRFHLVMHLEQYDLSDEEEADLARQWVHLWAATIEEGQQVLDELPDKQEAG